MRRNLTRFGLLFAALSGGVIAAACNSDELAAPSASIGGPVPVPSLAPMPLPVSDPDWSYSGDDLACANADAQGEFDVNADGFLDHVCAWWCATPPDAIPDNDADADHVHVVGFRDAAGNTTGVGFGYENTCHAGCSYLEAPP